MADERARSIVPMFGGATKYVETLDAILEFVSNSHPTTDELVDWHRDAFKNVSSRDSILHRVEYLHRVEFLDRDSDQWRLGEAGQEYLADQTRETLLQLMCDRNIGFESLLESLADGPMTLEDISEQQLETHAELDWSPEKTDMAKQRANWLRSLELVEKNGSLYELTDEGRELSDRLIGGFDEQSADEILQSIDFDGSQSDLATVQVIEFTNRFEQPILLQCTSVKRDPKGRKSLVIDFVDVNDRPCRLYIWNRHEVDDVWSEGQWYIIRNLGVKSSVSNRGRVGSTPDIEVSTIGTDISDKAIREILSEDTPETGTDREESDEDHDSVSPPKSETGPVDRLMDDLEF